MTAIERGRSDDPSRKIAKGFSARRVNVRVMRPPLSAECLLALLAPERPRLARFVRSRLGNPSDTDDVLQQSLVRAVQRIETLEDASRLRPWFYQIVRHVLVDHGRAVSARRRRDNTWAANELVAQTARPEPASELCRCFEPLLARLPELHATLLRRVELGGERVAAVAAVLGVSANRASVALHRARERLRVALAEACGTCAATRRCLACECDAR